MASLDRRPRRRKVCVTVSRTAFCEIQVAGKTDRAYISAARINDGKFIFGTADGVWISNGARYNSVRGNYLGADPTGPVPTQE